MYGDSTPRAGRSGGPSSTSRLVAALAFGTLAAAGGYWAVIKAPELSARRSTRRSSPPRGPCRAGEILDRDGVRPGQQRGGRERRAVPGLPERAVSHVVGYASPRYGRAGLELAFDAELAGLAGDPVARRPAQVRRRTRTTPRT